MQILARVTCIKIPIEYRRLQFNILLRIKIISSFSIQIEIKSVWTNNINRIIYNKCKATISPSITRRRTKRSGVPSMPPNTARLGSSNLLMTRRSSLTQRKVTSRAYLITRPLRCFLLSFRSSSRLLSPSTMAERSGTACRVTGLLIMPRQRRK